ncbi:MAG TPA: PEP-CTERM sorting domain-containing protein [Acidobacteriaceae bacterium]|nr:PEP-CTERM sorting domain-containing protein [Acidobacteriaceae bacterium]
MKPILRVPLVILMTLVAVSLGVVGVHATTQCVRFIQQRVRHHKVSAATLAKWQEWNKAHPNWHPKPTPKETWKKLEFACEVPLEQKAPSELLPPLELNPLELPLELTAPPSIPATNIATYTPPPQIFPEQPTQNFVTPPIYAPEYPGLYTLPPHEVGPGCPVKPACDSPPGCPKPPDCSVTPPPPTNTPEPSTWALMGTALLSLYGLYWKRKRAAAVQRA